MWSVGPGPVDPVLWCREQSQSEISTEADGRRSSGLGSLGTQGAAVKLQLHCLHKPIVTAHKGELRMFLQSYKSATACFGFNRDISAQVVLISVWNYNRVSSRYFKSSTWLVGDKWILLVPPDTSVSVVKKTKHFNSHLTCYLSSIFSSHSALLLEVRRVWIAAQ